MKRLEQVKNYMRFVTKYRDTIPDIYNQVELVNELMNNDVDYYISISSRSDGKTFNYIGFFMKLAIEFDIGFTLIGRHFTLRRSYWELIEKIAIENKNFNERHIIVKATDHYLKIFYKDKQIGIITDLNSATDLKYHSNVLKDYPIIIYDEFLALEGDYLIDEWDKLKTIYQSIDRNHDDIPYIKFPKIFLLGNAVNFNSPLLANLNIYERLQRHPMNTMRIKDNIALEIRRNDNTNQKRNSRPFDVGHDAMLTGEFDINTFNLASDALKDHIKKDGDYYFIKTDMYYLKVMFNIHDFETNISVVPYAKSYHFCTEVNDVDDRTIYLKDVYYKETHPKKYYKPSNLHFDNAYSKDYVTDDMGLIQLNINKCTKRYMNDQRMKNKNYTEDLSRHEKMYDDHYIERTKRYLLDKYSI